jgi:hypothetical protein
MNIMHDIFRRFFMRVGNVSVQLSQNKSPYIIAIVITYAAHRNDYKRANPIQLIANTPFPTANVTICHIQNCSYILIVFTSTKLTLKLLQMQTHTKHPLLTDTNRRFPFVIPLLWIRNCLMFLRKTLYYYVILAGFLLFYDRILNYLFFVAS